MYNYEAKVDKILDGDTIDLTLSLGFDIYIKERVRLFGVDTPETRTRNKTEKKAGLKAKQFVIDTIGDYDLEITTREKGKYGRYLAQIWVVTDEFERVFPKSVNEMLIEEGHAKAYFGGKKKAFI